MSFIKKSLRNDCAIFLLLLCPVWLSGCSYASGTIRPDGSLSFTVFRPYLEKPKIQLEYNPVTKELRMNVDTEVEHLNLKDLATAIGAGIGAAAKTTIP